MTDTPYKPPQKEDWSPRIPTKRIYLVTFLMIFTITGFLLYRGFNTWMKAQAVLDASEAVLKAEEFENQKAQEIK